MKQLFHISNTTSESGQEVLCVRLGPQHIAFCTTNKAATVLHELSYVTIEPAPGGGWNNASLAGLLETHPVLKASYYRVVISVDFPQSILMPAVAYTQQEGSVLIQSLYGKDLCVTVTEAIPEWQLMNIYAVPVAVQEWITAQFPSAKVMHQYTAGFSRLLAGEPGGCINLDIRRDDFTLMAAKNGKFLVAAANEYTSPEDILYQLINTVNHFGLSQSDTLLALSGLVDKESALYRELYQYFIRIEFRDATWQTEGYPAHFFTSLNDLARCVS
ncbi:MAG: DUF3822 family protein [Bacteroidetes bacterium]|nr:DUF3822 family protein [Bacteroidota bacterium]